MFPEREGVLDCLHELHPVPARERRAVAEGDRRAHSPAEGEHAGDIDVGAGEREEAERAYHRAIAEAREIVEGLLEREPLPAEPVVVEVGADYGWTSALLLDRGARVIATDISDHLRHASRGESEALCRIQADMNRLPVADGVADVVWATACAHHSWDLQRTFREIARVLGPGGRAYLCNEPLPAWPRYLFGFGFGREERARGINETWISRRGWLRRCRRAGLEPRLVFPAMAGERLERRLARRGLPKSLGWLPGRLLGRLLAPVLPWLQVSVHLIAERADGPVPDQSV